MGGGGNEVNINTKYKLFPTKKKMRTEFLELFQYDFIRLQTNSEKTNFHRGHPRHYSIDKIY